MTATMTREETLFLRGLEAPAKPSSRFTEAEIKDAVRRNKARVKREIAACVRKDSLWLQRLRELETELLNSKPHLIDQQFCGLADASTTAKPARRVTMSNGVVIYSTWYKVPTTDADHRRATKENDWLREQARLKWAATA